MSGVYGDQLAFFPEQFESATAFEMDPNVGAGYKKRKNEKATEGVFQWLKGGNLDVEEHMLAQADTIIFWTYDHLVEGMFLERADGSLFRITKTMEWNLTGGFYRFALETVVGNTDTQTTDTEVADGILEQYQ